MRGIRHTLIDTAVHFLTSLVPRIEKHTDPSKKSYQYLQQLTEDIKTLKDTKWDENERFYNLETLDRMNQGLSTAEGAVEALPQDLQEELGACLDVLYPNAGFSHGSLNTLRDR